MVLWLWDARYLGTWDACTSKYCALVLQAHLVLDEALGSGFVMDVNPTSVTAPLSKLPVIATRSSNIKGT
jgi:hypothetical protein